MRLTTLARKISITPKQLMSFLSEKGVSVENGIHGKLEKDITEMVLEHFLPEEEIEANEEVLESESDDAIDLIKVVEPDADNEEVIPQETVAEEIEDSISDTTDVDAEELTTSKEQKVGTVEDIESEEFEKVDLIKAKKVKLEGIKVVGKIKLPEKPEKIPAEGSIKEESNTQDEEPKKELSPSKNKSFSRDRRKNRHAKKHTELSYEEKMKEEAREKLKKRRRRENAERRRKQKYYQEHIEPKITKKSKKKKSSIEAQRPSLSPKKEVAVHKNPIKRLWAWLNGAYDKY